MPSTPRPPSDDPVPSVLVPPRPPSDDPVPSVVAPPPPIAPRPPSDDPLPSVLVPPRPPRPSRTSPAARWRLAPPLLALLPAASGCAASLPAIDPSFSTSERQALEAECVKAYPSPPWTASHAMDASLPFGKSAFLVGVTRLSDDAIESVLLSPEGLVLFDAKAQHGTVAVGRAVPPFDQKGFAAGLVADVRHMFVRPAAKPVLVGRASRGTPICRFRSQGDETTDVELVSDDSARIRNYHGRSLVREIDLIGVRTDGFSPELVLRVPGAMGYTLRLRLIEREILSTPAGARPTPIE